MYQAKASESLTPKIRAQLWAANHGHDDREGIAEILLRIPQRYHGKLLKGYSENLRTWGRREANLLMLEIGYSFRDARLSPAATDSEIRSEAENAAGKAWGIATRYKEEKAIRGAFLRLADSYKIEPPKEQDFGRLFNRMTSPLWWRRKLRRKFQKAEAALIRMGFVHRHAAPYLSDEAYARFEAQQRNTARLLESLEALNPETGECFVLSELAEHSQSNPANRRAEVMVRVKGMEAYAEENGYVGVWFTITCPSRMHAYLESGEPNPRYDGTTTKRAHAYLQKKVWELARSALDRAGVEYFGLRVVEPHHDGTPHWHGMAFVKPKQEGVFTETMRAYALRESPEEPGAKQHRFKVERIDKAKGGAAAYIAKYIAKNLDGHQVGRDFEAQGPAERTAPRAVAWARLWGIRQFQPFGTPAVTVWRELRRIKELTPAQEALIGAVWKAADEGNFAEYMRLQMDKANRLAPMWQEEESKCYRGEKTKRVVGLVLPSLHEDQPAYFVTHGASWEIRFKDKTEATEGRFGPPWTRVNNCTRLDLRGIPGESFSENGSPDELPVIGAFPPSRRAEKEKPPIGSYPKRRLSNTDSTGRSIAP